MKNNPFVGLTAFERGLWLSSVILITVSFIVCGDPDPFVLAASLVGATALIFVAKGYVIGQILTVLFALIYGYISLRFRYYGEMITYLGMSAPMAISAAVAWARNPYENGRGEVKVNRLTRRTLIILWVITAAVTAVFYFVLKALDTPNMFFSTVSITTSFLASGLTFLRSHYYALAYATNDLILIVLWILAAMTDVSSVPMAVCFVIFFVNDSYGFINWQRMIKRQSVGI